MSKRLKYPYFFQQRELSLNIGKLNLQADFRSCFLARILFLGGGEGVGSATLLSCVCII